MLIEPDEPPKYSDGTPLRDPAASGLRFLRCSECGQEELLPMDKPVPQTCWRCELNKRSQNAESAETGKAEPCTTRLCGLWS